MSPRAITFSMCFQKRWWANVRSVTRKSPAAAASRSRSARSATLRSFSPVCGAIWARRRLPRGTDDASSTATSTSIVTASPRTPAPHQPWRNVDGSTDSGFAEATASVPGSSNDEVAVSAPTAASSESSAPGRDAVKYRTCQVRLSSWAIDSYTPASASDDAAP